jgi:hypothetical protein
MQTTAMRSGRAASRSTSVRGTPVVSRKAQRRVARASRLAVNVRAEKVRVCWRRACGAHNTHFFDRAALVASSAFEPRRARCATHAGAHSRL